MKARSVSKTLMEGQFIATMITIKIKVLLSKQKAISLMVEVKEFLLIKIEAKVVILNRKIKVAEVRTLGVIVTIRRTIMISKTM